MSNHDKNLDLVSSKTGLVILTVAYNSKSSIGVLGASLTTQSTKPLLWLIVDNSPINYPLNPHLVGSIGKMINIRLITGEEGAGFAAGCNRGLQWLADWGWQGWVWLLNPDATLVQKGIIANLIKISQHLPEKALLGTAVYDLKGNLERSAGWISSGLNFRKHTITANRTRTKSRSLLTKVDWLSGCSILLKPSFHSPPPRFDEQFPLYYEDLDFCLRQAAHGTAILWTDAISIQHQRAGGSDTPSQRRLRLSTISYLRYLQRHHPHLQLYLRSLRLLSLTLLRLPIQPRRSLAVLQGLWEATTVPIL